MKQSEFLERNIFIDLENQNNGFDKTENLYFNEADFAKIIERATYYGLSIYSITPALDGKVLEPVSHESARKKATDPKWYSKAFKTLIKKEPGLVFTAHYKVSTKLLAK